MVISYSIDSIEGQRLQDVLKNKILTMEVDEDPEFVSQYIKAMIINQKSAEEILEGLTMFGDKFDLAFATWALDEAENLTPRSQQKEAIKDIPTGPRSQAEKVRKAGGQRQKANGFQAGLANLIKEKVSEAPKQNFNANNGTNNNFNKTNTNNGPPARCRHFPTCNYPNCVFSHPTEDCPDYPNCPRGHTCHFLHPQDKDDVAKGRRYRCHKFPLCTLSNCRFSHPSEDCPDYPNCSRGERCWFLHPEDKAKLAFIFGKPKASALCRFSDKCANPDCSFGHPTPCNNQANVINWEWCDNKSQCLDPNCDKAHPSGSLVRKPEPLPEKKVLDCKYGKMCANYNCKFRHASSPILCRNGASCERPDCFFSHPIDEPCRFAQNCTNKHCVYKHEKTSERQFVSDEPVEKLPVDQSSVPQMVEQQDQHQGQETAQSQTFDGQQFNPQQPFPIAQQPMQL